MSTYASVLKACGKCKVSQPISEFWNDRSSYDGHDSRCITCRKKEKIEYVKNNREKVLQQKRASYEKHKEATLAKMKVSDDANRANRRANSRRHYQNNKDAYKSRARDYQMRRANTHDEYVDRLVVLELDDGVCGICGGDVDPMNYHIDHVIPLSKGGRHNYANVQVACPPCNLAKKDREDI